MSSTVDNRVVNMQFNNRQFESGIQTSLRSLDALKKGLDLSGAAKSLSNLENAGKRFSMDNLSDNVSTISSRFSNLGIVGFTALQRITNAAITAGTHLVKSLTITPITTGLQEYETKMNSITTILTNTKSKGTTLDDVNAALAELNKYADQTIYNFAEMTRNIGTFTAAGVDLDTSVKAIKGIANLAAGSGSNAQQASTAMYQLSQALAAGSVKLQDWNSVVNAGMGGELFQNALKETAKQMGIVVNEGVPFRETLQDGWLTTDVLVKTLEKFAQDDTLVKAATQVKTFTQLIDTMQESVQSGWATSWEYIIGDKDQATEMLTAVSDAFNNLIGPSTDARNAMLKFWNENGGRDAVIEGISSAFKGLMSILKPIGQAFRDVFPATTGEQLVSMSKKFRDLMANFKIGEGTANSLRNAFKGVFSIIKLGVEVIKLFVKAVASIAGVFLPVLKGAVTIGGAFGALLNSFLELISPSKNVSKVIDEIGKKFEHFGDSIKPSSDAVANAFNAITDKVAAFASAVKTKLSEVFGASDSSDWLKIFNTGVLATIGIGLKKFIDTLSSTAESASGFLGSLTGILDGVRGSLETWQSSLKATILMKIAGAIAILAAALLVLGSIDSKRMASALAALTATFVELTASMLVMDKVMTGGGLIGMSKMSIAMLGLSTAVLILSVAMKNMEDLDWDDITKGLIGIATMSATLMASSKLMEKASSGLVRGSVGLAAFAGAMLILVKVVDKLGNLDVTTMAKGLIGVAILCKEIQSFLNKANFGKSSITGAASLILLSTALFQLSKITKKLGELKASELVKGVAAIGALLTELTLFSKMTGNSKNMLSMSASMVVVAKAIDMISSTFASFGGMSWGGISKSLVAIGASLAELSVGLKLMNGTIGGAAALTVAAGALNILAPVLAKLGGMKWTSIAKGLIAIGGALGVIGVASAILRPLVPTIFSLSAALLLFGTSVALAGTGMVAIGAGLTSIAVGIGSLAGLGTAGLTAVTNTITAIFTGIGNAIPMIIQKIGEGMLLFAQTIIQNGPIITQAVSTLLLSLLQAISTTIPQAVNLIAQLLTSLLQTFALRAPEFIKAGADLIVNVLNGLAQNIGRIVEAGVNLVVKFLNAVASKISSVIKAGINLMLAFINGLADGVRNNADKIGSAIANVITAVLEAAVKIILGFGGKFLKEGAKLIKSLVKGIKSLKDSVVGAAKKMISDFIDGIKSKWEDLKGAGKDAVKGFIKGIKSLPGDIADAAKELAGGFIDKVKGVFKIHSPSRVMKEIGENVVKGFAIGIKTEGKKLKGTIDKIFVKSVDVMAMTTKEAVKYVGENMKFGSKALNAFIKEYANFNSEVGNYKVIDQAAKAINRYGWALYKETDQYKEDLKAKNADLKALKKLREERDKIQKQIAKLEKDNSTKSKNKVKKLKEDLKDVKAAIKEVNSQVVQDTKTMAQHAKETYLAMRDSIKESVKSFIDPLQVSLDTQIDLFKKFGSDTEVTIDEILENMKSQVEGVTQWNADLNALAKKGFAKGLIEELKNMGPTGANYVKAFMEMTEEQMKTANEHFAATSKMTAETLIKNFGDTLQTAKDWVSKIQDLSRTGLNQGIIEALGNMGVQSSEYVDAFMSMTAEQIAQFNKQYEQYLKLPSTVADKVIASFVFAGENASSAFIQQLTGSTDKESDNSKRISSNAKAIGEEITKALASGINSGKESLADKAGQVSKLGLEGLTKNLNKTKGKTIGKNVCNGIVNGLNAGSNAVTEMAKSVASAAFEAAKAELEINSPSRKFAELGMYAVKGLAKGLINYSKNAVNAAKDVGSSSIEGMKDAISRISDIINDDIDMNPVIRPVLDLSDVKSGAKNISGILATRSVKLAQSASNTKAIAGRLHQENQNESSAQTVPKKEISVKFEQNNYSPKSLSRLDIYRQTKNQFSAAKGVLDSI